MLTLNIGYNSKKQGDEPYSSVGASCNLAVEASDELLKHPEALQSEMSRLFDEVKAAVNQQIANGNGNGNGKAAVIATSDRVTPATKVRSQEPAAGNGRDQMMTPKQRQFLISLLQRKFKGGIPAFEAHLKEEGISSLSQLTRKQASQIIDSLNGGRR